MKRSLYILFSAILLIAACESQKLDYSVDLTESSGTGGSLARFTISGNYLYTVDVSKLKTFDITNEKNPQLMGEVDLGWGIETIFALGDLLFLGAQNGIYIFDISNPALPQYLSSFNHIQSCDPVVVKGNYAYSTLNSAGPCSQGLNQLDIIDISNPESPFPVNSLPMESPKGLGISDDLLFVCDEGLKVFDLVDPVEPELLRTIQIDAYDVIPIDTLLLIATEQGLSEYSIDEDNQIHFISSVYSQP
jgi:hypothetical protein